MPRRGPRRPQVAFRIDADKLILVDRAAQLVGVNRSEMLRLMVSHALLTGYRPRT
jgi:uncharacterized protein (DUF1778 family)